MNPTLPWTEVAALALALATLGLCWLVISRRVQLALGTEVALGLGALSLCATAAALWEGRLDSPNQAGPLLLVGSGGAALVLSILTRRAARMRAARKRKTRDQPAGAAGSKGVTSP